MKARARLNCNAAGANAAGWGGVVWKESTQTLGNFGKSHLPRRRVDGASPKGKQRAGVGVLKMDSSANVKSTLVRLGKHALCFI